MLLDTGPSDDDDGPQPEMVELVSRRLDRAALRWQPSRSSRSGSSRWPPLGTLPAGSRPGIGAHAAETGLLATFPVEGWAESAAVDVWQTDDGIVHGEVHGTTDVEAARRQVARSLSLDHDGARLAGGRRT